MRKLIWMLLGALVTTIPYLLLTSTISLNTFGLVALGMGLGVLLFALIFVALWNNT